MGTIISPECPDSDELNMTTSDAMYPSQWISLSNGDGMTMTMRTALCSGVLMYEITEQSSLAISLRDGNMTKWLVFSSSTQGVGGSL